MKRTLQTLAVLVACQGAFAQAQTFYSHGSQGSSFGYSNGSQQGQFGINRNGSGYGSYRGNDGTRANGQFNRNGGQFGYQSSNGTQYGGHVQSKGSNFQAGGHQYDRNGNGYGGYVGRQNGSVGVGGDYRRPGTIPGTQERYGANGVYQGRDSRGTGRVEIYDGTGRNRLGGVTGSLDRRTYTQGQDARLGPMQSGTNHSVRFGGVNSSYTQTQSAGVQGVGGYQASGTASRNGVSVNGGVRMGGFGASGKASVDRNGLHVSKPSFTAPKVSVPKVSVPKVSVPKVSVPKVSAPKRPSVKVGGFSF